VTAVSFSISGQHLAVGDKAGRICVFESNGPRAAPQSRKEPEFQYYSEFQSHDIEFDALKSLEIEEKINMIEWLKRRTSALFLLSTNGEHARALRGHTGARERRGRGGFRCELPRRNPLTRSPAHRPARRQDHQAVEDLPEAHLPAPGHARRGVAEARGDSQDRRVAGEAFRSRGRGRFRS
jgi:hypothetical protein